MWQLREVERQIGALQAKRNRSKAEDNPTPQIEALRIHRDALSIEIKALSS